MKYHWLNSKNPDKRKGNDVVEDISVESLGENARSILIGYENQNINNQNETEQEKARKKIFYDVEWGRITEDEASYLMDYFGW